MFLKKIQCFYLPLLLFGCSNHSLFRTKIVCKDVSDKSPEFIERNFNKIKSECFGDKADDYLASITKRYNEEYVNCFTNNPPYYCQTLLGIKYKKNDLSVNQSIKVPSTPKIDGISIANLKDDNEKIDEGIRFFDDLSGECLSQARKIVSSGKDAISLKRFKSKCLYKDFELEEVKEAFTSEELKYCEEQFGEIGCEIAIGSYLFPKSKDISSNQLFERNQLENIFAKYGLRVIETKNADINSDGILDKMFLVKGTDQGKIVLDKYYSGGKRDLNRRGIVVFLGYEKFFRLAVYKPFLFHSEDSDGGVYYPPEIDVSFKRDGLYIDYMHGRYGSWKYVFSYDSGKFALNKFSHYTRSQLNDEFQGFESTECDIKNDKTSRSFDCMFDEFKEESEALAESKLCEEEAAKFKKSVSWNIKGKNKKIQISLSQIDVIRTNSILNEVESSCSGVFDKK